MLNVKVNIEENALNYVVKDIYIWTCAFSETRFPGLWNLAQKVNFPALKLCDIAYLIEKETLIRDEVIKEINKDKVSDYVVKELDFKLENNLIINYTLS